MNPKKKLMHECIYCGEKFAHVKKMRAHLKSRHLAEINKGVMSNVKSR